MKGQLTIEYMFVSFLAVLLLGISLASLSKITSDAENSKQVLDFKFDSERVFNGVEEVCILGNGNSIKLELNQFLHLDSNANIISLSFENHSISRSSVCTFEDLSLDFENEIVISNSDGKISFN